MRLYTESEARALLPEVVAVLERLRSAFLRLRALNAAVSSDARGASGDGNLITTPWEHTEGENLADKLGAQLRSAAAQLERWGIELKDPEKGLIDFYHERDGGVVYLCYMLGEDDITYWHQTDAGFAGRQPL
jgi:hypothetical protein